MWVCRSTFIPPDYRLRAVMQGTLDTFGVVEILQMLGRMHSSGTLHIECPQRLIDVHFSSGRIAETRDSTRVAADTVIGSQLLKRSLVNEAQLQAALAEQEARPRPVGTILVERGAVKEAALREVLSRQIANTLVAAKLEAAGTFVFIVDPAPAPVDCITVDTQSVLLDISALGGEYCLAIEMLGQPSTVLVRNGDYNTLPRNPVLMGRDEFLVLVQVDGVAHGQGVTVEPAGGDHRGEHPRQAGGGRRGAGQGRAPVARRRCRGAAGAPRQCLGRGQPAARRHLRRADCPGRRSGGW